MVQPYVKNTGVFICPSKSDWVCREPGSVPTTSYRGGYAVNYAYRGQSGYRGPVSYGLRESDIPVPADTILASDMGSDSFIYTIHCDSEGNHSILPNKVRSAARHMDGLNCLFVDGHVKWMQAAQALQQSTTAPNRYRLWSTAED